MLRGFVTDDATNGLIVSGTVLRLLGIQALTRTATIELSYDTSARCPLVSKYIVQVTNTVLDLWSRRTKARHCQPLRA